MPKVTGFTQRKHPYQVISYIIFFGDLAIYAFIIFPLSNLACKIIGLTLAAVFGILTITYGAICTSIDPTDEYVIQTNQSKNSDVPYDPPKKDFYCSSCYAYVQEKSKHCRQCNRCVENFDHHCKWINNCVGGKNYKPFIRLITSVLAFTIVFVVFALTLTIQYALDQSLQANNILLYQSSQSIQSVMILLWIFGVITVALLIMDFHLVLLHFWLIRHKLTTYEYIIARKEKKEINKTLKEMGVLDENSMKRTCLDFILCLKEKKKKEVTSSKEPPSSEGKAMINNNNNNNKEEVYKSGGSTVKQVVNGTIIPEIKPNCAGSDSKNGQASIHLNIGELESPDRKTQNIKLQAKNDEDYPPPIVTENERNSVDQSLPLSIRVEHTFRTEENEKNSSPNQEVKEVKSNHIHKKEKNQNLPIMEQEEDIILSATIREKSNKKDNSARLDSPAKTTVDKGSPLRVEKSKANRNNLQMENIGDDDESERQELNRTRSFDIKKGKFADIVVAEPNSVLSEKYNNRTIPNSPENEKVISFNPMTQNKVKLGLAGIEENIYRTKDIHANSDVTVTAV